MTPINFKASFIREAPVKKLENNRYVPAKASFIELDPKDYNDLTAIKEISENWEDAKYAKIIYNAIYYDMTFGKPYKRHFYAITTQKDIFEKPDSKQILGISEFKEYQDSNELSFIQTRPENITYKERGLLDSVLNTIGKIFPIKQKQTEQNPEPKPEYTGIGSGMIHSMIEESNKNDITLYADDKAKYFYRKLGFRPRFWSDDENLLTLSIKNYKKN